MSEKYEIDESKVDWRNNEKRVEYRKYYCHYGLKKKISLRTGNQPMVHFAMFGVLSALPLRVYSIVHQLSHPDRQRYFGLIHLIHLVHQKALGAVVCTQ